MTVDQVVVIGSDPIDASKEFAVEILEVPPPPPSFPWWIVLAGIGAVAIYYAWKKT